MTKLFATLFAGAFALTLGTSAFALDAAKPTKATEPAKVEEVKAAEPSKTETAAKPVKKHHRKHDKKMEKAAETPAATEAK
jgi:hypothetical protein